MKKVYLFFLSVLVIALTFNFSCKKNIAEEYVLASEVTVTNSNIVIDGVSDFKKLISNNLYKGSINVNSNQNERIIITPSENNRVKLLNEKGDTLKELTVQNNTFYFRSEKEITEDLSFDLKDKITQKIVKTITLPISIITANLNLYLPLSYASIQRIVGESNSLIFHSISTSSKQNVVAKMEVKGNAIAITSDKLKNLVARQMGDSNNNNINIYEIKPVETHKITIDEIKAMKEYLIAKGYLKSSKNNKELSSDSSLQTQIGDLYVSKFEVPYTATNIGTANLTFLTNSNLNKIGAKAEDSIIVKNAQFSTFINSASSFVNQKKDLTYTISYTDQKIYNNNVVFDVVMEGENLGKMGINMYWDNSNIASDNTDKKLTFKNIKAKDFVKNANNVYEFTKKVNYTLFDFNEQSIKFTTLANTTSTDQFSTTHKLKATTTNLISSLNLGSTYGNKDEQATLTLSYIDKNTYDNNTTLNYVIKTSNDLSVLINAYNGASNGNILEGSISAQNFILENGIYKKDISFKYNLKTKNQVDFTANISTNTLEKFEVKQSITPSNLQGITFNVNPASTLGFVEDVIDYNFNYTASKIYTDNVKFRLKITANSDNISFKYKGVSATKTVTTDWISAQNFENNNGNYKHLQQLYYNLNERNAVTLICDLETSSGDVFSTTKTVQAVDIVHNASVSVDNASVMPLNTDNLKLLLSFTNELIRTKQLNFLVSLNTNNNTKFGVKYQGANYTYGSNISIASDAFAWNNVTNRYEKEVVLTYIPANESTTIVTIGTKTSSDVEAKSTSITITPKATASNFNPLSFSVWKSNVLVSDFVNSMFFDYNKIQINDVNTLATYDLKVSKTGLNGALSNFVLQNGSDITSVFTNNAYNRNLALSNTQIFSFGIRNDNPASSVGSHKITITAKRNYDGREFSKDTIITIGGSPINLVYSSNVSTISAGELKTSVAPSVDWQGSVGTFAISGQPVGVSINASTGVLSFDGTTALGTYTMSVTSTNASGTSLAVAYTLNVTQIGISSFGYSTNSISHNRTSQVITSVAPTLNTGVGNVSYSIMSSAIRGVNINASTGVLSFAFDNTTPVGDYTITIRVTNSINYKETTYNLNIYDAPINLSYSPAVVTFQDNVAGSSVAPNVNWQNKTGTFAIISTNSSYPTIVTDGKVKIDATTGVISWIADIDKTLYTFEVTATNVGGGSIKTNFAIDKRIFAPSGLSYATSTTNYQVTRDVNASSGVASVNWGGEVGTFAIISSTITGILINTATGEIVVEPQTRSGQHTIKVKASNSKGSVTTQYIINVSVQAPHMQSVTGDFSVSSVPYNYQYDVTEYYNQGYRNTSNTFGVCNWVTNGSAYWSSSTGTSSLPSGNSSSCYPNNTINVYMNQSRTTKYWSYNTNYTKIMNAINYNITNTQSVKKITLKYHTFSETFNVSTNPASGKYSNLSMCSQTATNYTPSDDWGVCGTPSISGEYLNGEVF